MTALIALLAGILFGAGLLLSRMTNPANVIAFLDVAAWRPALAFTMIAAIAVALPAFAIVRARGASILGQPVAPIDRTRIDWPLLLGSAVFGIGWGLCGICPGPGLVLLTSIDPRAFLFIGCVAVGTYAAGLVPSVRKRV
jgi:uncharacterized membrane protein YedE/YeeE